MRTNYLKYALVLVMAFLMSGCASFLTLVSPVQSKVVVKDKKPGDVESYTYHYDLQSSKIYLTKTPLCKEVAEMERVSQKREIGYSPAMVEMVFFGLGLVDLVEANGISEGSKSVDPMGEVDTGKVMVCGSPQPAANEALVIESRQLKLFRKVITDGNGMIDLDDQLKETSGVVHLKIYPESDRTAVLSCIYRTHQMASGQESNQVKDNQEL